MPSSPSTKKSPLVKVEPGAVPEFPTEMIYAQNLRDELALKLGHINNALMAKALGLPPHTSREQIKRVTMAMALGLPPHATLEDIELAAEFERRQLEAVTQTPQEKLTYADIIDLSRGKGKTLMGTEGATLVRQDVPIPFRRIPHHGAGRRRTQSPRVILLDDKSACDVPQAFKAIPE